MKEIWRLFRDGYTCKSGPMTRKIEPIYVSNFGGIRGRKLRNNGRGYIKFSYKHKDYNLHKVVAELFIPYTGLNPDGTPIKGKPQVNHKDENKLNNCVDNLEWCDAKYNCNYGTRTKRAAKKLFKPVQCVETGKIFGSAKEADEYYNLKQGSVNHCANPNSNHKTAAKFHWKYI